MSIPKEINSEYSMEGAAPKLWPSDAKSWLLKRPWCWERLKAKGEGGSRGRSLLRYYHQFNGHEFEQTPGDSEGQRSLACCSSQGCRVRHDLVTEHHHELFQKMFWTRKLPNSFQEANNTLAKTKEIIRKPQTDITHGHGCKNPQQNSEKPNPGTYKQNYIAWPSCIYPASAKVL